MRSALPFFPVSALLLAFAGNSGAGCHDVQHAAPEADGMVRGCEPGCSSNQVCLDDACSDRACSDAEGCGSGQVCAASGACQTSSDAQSRDPWLWPFDAGSIWNQPIGTDAVYRPAGLEPAGNTGVDIQHLLRVTSSDPERMVFESPDFGETRCRLETPALPFTLRVPDNWIVEDVGPSNPYGLTPNSNAAFLLDDGDSLLQLLMVSRCVAGGPVYAPWFYRFQDNQPQVVSIRGDGMAGGGQGASGMSSMGGNIRLGELTGERPLRHAIKLNPWAHKYLHYSEAVPGYRWPANGADNYADDPVDGYDPVGSFGRPLAPWLAMGSLLAIPPSVRLESLGLRTVPGRILFEALQLYGAYFTEDAAWDTWDLIVERGVPQEVAAASGADLEDVDGDFGHDLNVLVTLLYVVDDNGPTSIGGGGPPGAQLAPPFTN